MITCEYCKYEYSIPNISRHIKYYCKFNPNIVVRPKITCSYCMSELSTKGALKYHLSNYCKNKPKLLLKKKTVLSFKPRNKHDISDNVSESDSEVKYKSDTGNSILDKIIDKLGKEAGLDYLIGNFLTKNFEKIIEKSYLEDLGSDDYPFSCKKRYHFRYYDKNNEMIDDVNGTLLSKAIHKGIQNAALTAIIIIIKKHIDNNSNSKELYDTYDLAQLQTLVYKMTRDNSQVKIKKYLAERTLNPNHPYFKAQIIDTSKIILI